MEKPATVEHDIEPLLVRRWSPRAFGQKEISAQHLAQLFEAARWAPSCFNEQPWRFVVAARSDRASFERMSSWLVDANRAWAVKAPLLMLSIARTTFTRNDKPNRHAYHDVGLALGNLVLQASALGLVVHQMAGFDVERARKGLELPEAYDPVAMIALGHPGDPADLSDELRERELAPRTRKPLAELVFGGSFDTPLELPPSKGARKPSR